MTTRLPPADAVEREPTGAMFQALQRFGTIVSSSLHGQSPAGVVARARALRDERDAAAHRARAAIAAAAAVVDAQARSPIELLAFAAHELRGPLVPIRAAAALLTIGDPAQLVRAQAIIERQVAHMSRMIEDLLDVSRGLTGKLRLVLEVVEISTIADRVVDVCRPALVKRRQRLEIRGLDGECSLLADAVRLTQILTNLLDNASKYSADGLCISLHVRKLDRAVELVVGDEGIGIAGAMLENVFLPFAQDAHAVDFNASGLGLGLAVVRDLVTAHGGTVVAHSEGIGCGSRFVVTLPRIVD